MYLDLTELDEVFRGRWLWSTRRAALARFSRLLRSTGVHADAKVHNSRNARKTSFRARK